LRYINTTQKQSKNHNIETKQKTQHRNKAKNTTQKQSKKQNKETKKKTQHRNKAKNTT
jgi:hypothetical protein